MSGSGFWGQERRWQIGSDGLDIDSFREGLVSIFAIEEQVEFFGS